VLALLLSDVQDKIGRLSVGGNNLLLRSNGWCEFAQVLCEAVWGSTN
jgi:hypothetical protein